MKYYQFTGLIVVLVLMCCVRNSESQNCSGVFTTYVVVDGSGSISSENFRSFKEALKIYINESISTNSAVKIGVVVYSDSVTKVIQASSDITSLNTQVDNIVHPQGGTATNLGIDRAKELLLTDPSYNPMVMIVITDGVSQRGDLTINSSQEARDVGIAMIAVGITGVFNAFPSIKQRFEAELLGIAGSSETDVLVKDFSDLVKDMIKISRRICRVVVLIQQQLEDRTVLVGSNPLFRTTLSQADIRTGTWTWQGRDLTTDNRYIKNIQSFVQTLTIPIVQLYQSGNYTFTIGTIPTTATLTVLDLITDVTIGAGGTATFRTTVSPSSAGFWSKDGNRISASSKYFITENGGNRELRITGGDMSDQGRYSYTVNGVSTVASLIVEAVIVHGGYTLWSPWIDITPCLATCGNNALKTARRTRTCTNPTPANGGNDCQLLGPSSETTTVDCGQSIRCAVDGGVGQWGAWSSVDCPVTCGFSPDGARNRSRLCDSPEPSGGGRDCTDSLVERETRPCNAGQCPIDGGISPWTSWGPAVCNVTCGVNIIGLSTRERLCNRPIPSLGGRNCTESRSETIPARCILPPCPVDGNWGGWTAWSNIVCDRFCGPDVNGRETRTRECDNPRPTADGNTCTGLGEETKTVICPDVPCPAVIVHGGYTPWSAWIDITSCLSTCGNNALKTATRTRSCTNPPANGGNNCQLLGPSSETKNIDCGQSVRCAVDGGVGQWGTWSSVVCPVTCSFSPDGVRKRSRLCDSPEPSGGGRNCTDSLVERETRPCYAGQCPIDGGISPWTSWGPAVCNVMCGEDIMGVSTRERLCNRPIPSLGGRNCTESRSETIPAHCILPPCPVDGNWGGWTAWSNRVCDQSCGPNVNGRETRTRECDNPRPAADGNTCPGLREETRTVVCPDVPCPVDGNWGAWTAWVGECDQTCGTNIIGRESRTRLCNNPPPSSADRTCPGDSEERRTISCPDNMCPVDGVWGAWQAWNFACNGATCGNYTGAKSRLRECNSPPPSGTGRFCPGEDVETSMHSCTGPPCSVDGGEGPWQEWTIIRNCPQTCGSNVFYIRQRLRACDNPRPQSGGADCKLTLNETQTLNCGWSECPIHGGWSPWGQWTPPNCQSWSCGDREGPSVRTKTCTNPNPQYGGRTCPGPADEISSRPCGLPPCPIDGTWNLWSAWVTTGQCNVTCGGGSQPYTRSRVCNQPQFGGQPCQGSANDATTRVCNTYKCPVDGTWNPWSAWVTTGQCNVTCGGGSQPYTRSRVCNQPKFGEQPCQGSANDATTRVCNTFNCPIDGTWNPWGAWVTTGQCNVTCGGGSQPYTRSRVCNQPQFGGQPCQGSANDATTRVCNTFNCPIDGTWNPWSAWITTGQCSNLCGGGFQPYTRSRVCNQPQFGGQPCQGSADDATTRVCNTNNCRINGTWNPWNAWIYTGQCNVTCGGGSQPYTRSRVCNQPQFGGQPCQGSGFDVTTRVCNTNDCPIDGNWGGWTAWSSRVCDQSCGPNVNGRETRTRECDNLRPAADGNTCPGFREETQTVPCPDVPCPVDGKWGEWTAWFRECDQTCGTNVNGRESRTRLCNSPAPSFIGRTCPGDSEERRTTSCLDITCLVLETDSNIMTVMIGVIIGLVAIIIIWLSLITLYCVKGKRNHNTNEMPDTSSGSEGIANAGFELRHSGCEELTGIQDTMVGHSVYTQLDNGYEVLPDARDVDDHAYTEPVNNYQVFSKPSGESVADNIAKLNAHLGNNRNTNMTTKQTDINDGYITPVHDNAHS